MVWQYRNKRATCDEQTLNLQRNPALANSAGDKQAKSAGFVNDTDEGKAFNENDYERAMKLLRFKGYLTNIPVCTVPAAEMIGSYYDLWHVEQSFRMSKTDLRARPIFYRSRDAIEAHLTIVLPALVLLRFRQEAKETAAELLPGRFAGHQSCGIQIRPVSQNHTAGTSLSVGRFSCTPHCGYAHGIDSSKDD